jgi:hypothetical protein
VAQRLCGRRRLAFRMWQCIIDASPAWRAGCPDGHRRPCEIRIVERSDSNENQMWSSLSFAKHRSAAVRAESAAHSVATVRHTRVLTRRTRDLEGRCAKASANRPAACAQVLAIAAPTHSRRNRRFSALPANRAAKASSCYRHLAPQGQTRGSTAAQIVLSAAISTAPPNPSIERTSQRPLRALWSTAHVER